MDKLVKLIEDIGKLWQNYAGAYFTGIQNTLILAVAATLAGCIIGLVCGILNTIPYTKQDNIVMRFFLKLIRVLVRIMWKCSGARPWCCRRCLFSTDCLILPTALWPLRA